MCCFSSLFSQLFCHVTTVSVVVVESTMKLNDSCITPLAAQMDEELPSMGSYLELPRSVKGLLPTRPATRAHSEETHRNDVMKSLKRLHDKIGRLELNCRTTESDMKSLANETAACRGLLNAGAPLPNNVEVSLGSHQEQERIHKALQKVELRLSQMEHQLERMRGTVLSGEEQRNCRVSKLSKETDNYFCQLEALLQEDASGTVHNYDDTIRSDNCLTLDVKQTRPHKETEHPEVCAPCSSRAITSPPLPFIVGTATATSHHLGANLQSVKALLKHHIAVQPSSPRKAMCDSAGGITVAAADVSRVLGRLKKNLSKLQDEHHDLLCRLTAAECTPAESCVLMEQLTELAVALESKAQQMQLLRAHREHLLSIKQKVDILPSSRSRNSSSSSLRSATRRNSQLKSGAKRSFQSSLQHKDLCWE